VTVSPGHWFDRDPLVTKTAKQTIKQHTQDSSQLRPLEPRAKSNASRTYVSRLLQLLVRPARDPLDRGLNEWLTLRFLPLPRPGEGEGECEDEGEDEGVRLALDFRF